MPGTYQYEPGNIAEYGKDRMRFELGDVMVEGKEKTCALCDEEYNAVIPEKVPTARQWKKAKLRCLESIMRKFAFEPDTKVGPLSLSMGERAKLWKEMYDPKDYLPVSSKDIEQMYEDLKKDLKASAASAEAILPLAENPETGRITPPYFYAGMMSHEETEGEDI